MTVRKPLQCSECGAKVLTRAAIGHGNYQEFAFPCPNCGVEIRFGMNLYQELARWEYATIKNAKWIESETGIINEMKLDGESLIPTNDNDVIMPFVKTVFLSENFEKFREDQSIRFFVVQKIWPTIEKLIHYYRNDNNELFIKQLGALEKKGEPKNRKERTVLLIEVLDEYGVFFRMRRTTDEQVVRQRINLGENISKNEVNKLIDYLKSKGKDQSLFLEIENIRNTWAKNIYYSLFPIFNIFYWDKSKYNLDSYTLCQKRFDDFKQFYVDCFETFCGVSLIAASLEGIILNGSHRIPKKNGEMRLESYEKMNNGTKPDILKNLGAIGNIFVPYIDSRLRNGIGHHSAIYNVSKDCIEYQNQSTSGVQHFDIPYIRFCEKIVQLYVQIEIVSLYVNWILGKVSGMNTRIV